MPNAFSANAYGFEIVLVVKSFVSLVLTIALTTRDKKFFHANSALTLD